MFLLHKVFQVLAMRNENKYDGDIFGHFEDYMPTFFKQFLYKLSKQEILSCVSDRDINFLSKISVRLQPSIH